MQQIPSKHSGLKQKRIFIISQFLWIKNLGLTSSLKSLTRLNQIIGLGYSHQMDRLGLEDQRSGWYSHTIGKLVLAVHRKPQCFSVWTFPQGCLGVLTTWRLASPSVIHPRASGKAAMCFVPSRCTSHTVTFSIFIDHLSHPYSRCEGITQEHTHMY